MLKPSKSAPFKPCILTANDLIQGDVIYYADGQWVRALEHAQIFFTPEEAQLALKDVKESETVGAYLAPVKVEQGRPSALHFREAFRAKGPSNYIHGKQENVSV